MRLDLRVPAADAGKRLDDILQAALADRLGTAIARSAIRRLVMSGAVRVDGRPLRAPGRALTAGARLVVDADPGRLRPEPRAETPPVRILYEDADVLAVDKPAGLPTHVTADPARTHLVAEVQRLLAGRGVADAHLGVHQRLDVETSGVVLFARSAAADRGLAAQFEARGVEKVYLALTGRPRALPPETFTIEGALGSEGRGRSRRAAPVEGGQPARTDCRLRRVLPDALVIEARPRTGRRHQIRAHLAEAGMPLLGDTRYGGPTRAAGHSVPRVMLHATRLALRHPVTGVPLVIESAPPADFQALLDALATNPARARARPRRR